jgi:hypothetical protein
MGVGRLAGLCTPAVVLGSGWGMAQVLHIPAAACDTLLLVGPMGTQQSRQFPQSTCHGNPTQPIENTVLPFVTESMWASHVTLKLFT